MRCYNLRESCDFVLRSATVTYNHSLSIKKNVFVKPLFALLYISYYKWKCPIDFLLWPIEIENVPLISTNKGPMAHTSDCPSQPLHIKKYI